MARATRLQARRELPICKDRIEPSGKELLRKQRRRAEHLVDGVIKITMHLLTRQQPKQKPALVERRPRDAEPTTDQIVEATERRRRQHLNRTQSTRVRHETPIGTAGALARHPEQVGYDDVDPPRLQCHQGRLARGEFHDLEPDPFGVGEIVPPNHVQLPCHAAELQDPQADRRLCGIGLGRCGQGSPPRARTRGHASQYAQRRAAIHLHR